ncbi:MAG: hypothetical protein LBT01_09670 [Spirochaetaceae bacterium]|jgi:hypothetical protein|nr:hypothetical protein [Spirochaetaceae bacterium]
MKKKKNVYLYRGESKNHEFLTPTALRDNAFDDPRVVVNKNHLERYDLTYGKTLLPFSRVDKCAYKCCFLSLANYFLQVQNEIKHGNHKKIFFEYCRSKYARKLLDIDTEKELLDKCYEYTKHIFNGPVLSTDDDSQTQFNNLFLTMSDYQHLNVLHKAYPNAYLPSMMLDFTECKCIADDFASQYLHNKIIYRVNYSRISELLSFHKDLNNALTGAKDIKTSELNLSLLGVVHWLETNNELTRNERAINIFWPWKIAKSEIDQTHPKGTLGYILDIGTVKPLQFHAPNFRGG